jgi:hypothetical protein
MGVFVEINAERERQDKKWGEQNHPIRKDEWHDLHCEAAERAKQMCDTAFQAGRGTWMHILQEEFCEVFAEATAKGQRAELVQVAAVAVSMIECIDRRSSRAKDKDSPDA